MTKSWTFRPRGLIDNAIRGERLAPLLNPGLDLNRVVNTRRQQVLNGRLAFEEVIQSLASFDLGKPRAAHQDDTCKHSDDEASQRPDRRERGEARMTPAPLAGTL